MTISDTNIVHELRIVILSIYSLLTFSLVPNNMKYEFDVSWLIFCLMFPVYVFFIEGWNFLPGLMSAALLSMLLAASHPASHHQLVAQLLMRRGTKVKFATI